MKVRSFQCPFCKEVTVYNNNLDKLSGCQHISTVRYNDKGLIDDVCFSILKSAVVHFTELDFLN